MMFKSRRAFAFLLGNRKVATLRNYRYVEKQTVYIKDREGKIIGKGKVEKVMPAEWDNIMKYCKMSGFKHPFHWVEEAAKLHGMPPYRYPRFIVIVSLREVKCGKEWVKVEQE